ncbi:hypothetical protein Q9252_00020 [Marinobacter salarius]|uniref:hypothetical protein n=1 Tax=Marinobacter salarius TaxID=1420917 RepID=UPI00273BEF20|nr:hypothetical protein [Marinobacter salarius]MDP4530501.1 hypothetical protein [Marinobacter salarius]
MLENIGLIIASLTAIYGVNEWRRELKGRREYELAEEVLTLVYDCRERLRAIRSPFSHTGEGATREADANETPEQTELFNRAYIVFERYEQHREEFAKLFALRYRFMAVFGQESAEPLEGFRKSLNEVFVSANMLPTYWLRQGRVQMEKDEFERHLKEMHEHESVFWGTLSEKDHFNDKVEDLVSEIEAVCARIIRPQPFWKRVCYLVTERNTG